MTKHGVGIVAGFFGLGCARGLDFLSFGVNTRMHDSCSGHGFWRMRGLLGDLVGSLLGRFGILLVVIGIALIASAGFASPGWAQEQAAGSKTGSVTGLALPRFVSLKASRVNLRKGPGTKYPTAWVFQQAGLPVEVVAEFEAWRQVRDSEGTKGWVLRTLLSGRRTAQVTPWDASGEGERPRVTIVERPSAGARAVALVEAGVVADIHNCDGQWCYVGISQFRGFVAQAKLWGVYKGERVR